MSEERGMEELDNVIILEDEDGNPVSMEFLDLIEHEGEEYVVLYPCEEEEQDGEVVILQIAETDDPEEEAHVSTDDEKTVNAVFELFKEKFKDQFNFAE